MNRLLNKVAIVTGGAAGIGAAIAEILASEGASVLVADIDAAGAEHQALYIRNQGGRALALTLDLGDEASIGRMIECTAAEFGGIDVLVNNAANTALPATQDRDIASMESDVWDETMRINLRGTMFAIKHAIPLLSSRGGGSIVNLTSCAGLSGADGPSAYAASKAGVIALTQYVATQQGKHGIRCNAIAPGLIVKPGAASPYSATVMQDMMLRHILVPRVGAPTDIAWAVVWLASDESAFVTGQCITIDGGMLAHQPYLADARAMISA